MKIVHIALQAPYNEGWGYQENLLTKHQAKLGHDVTLITTCTKNTSNALIIDCEPEDYTSPDGFRVIRLKRKAGLCKKLYSIFAIYDIYDLLESLFPDCIMIHGLGSLSVLQVEKHIKRCNPNCVLIIDSHTCEINTDAHKAKTLKQRLVLNLANSMRKPLYPYAKKIFGITPACVEYAIKYYKAPEEKMALLPLGFDPDVCFWEEREQVRLEMREKLGLEEKDIVIVHGGKIIRRRKTPETIEAVMRINDHSVKLVVFGGMDAEMKPTVESLIQKYRNRVIYLDSLTPQEYNKVYCASDLALFPGGQSVLWQQAIGCGLPIIVGNDKDLDYLNRGGNVAYIDDTSVDGIYKVLLEVLQEKNIDNMKFVAENQAREFFSYERIAKLVTDCVEL